MLSCIEPMQCRRYPHCKRGDHQVFSYIIMVWTTNTKRTRCSYPVCLYSVHRSIPTTQGRQPYELTPTGEDIVHAAFDAPTYTVLNTT